MNPGVLNRRGCPRKSLNGKWLSRADRQNAGMQEKWYLSPADSAGWQPTQVPGPWQERSHHGPVWYRRRFRCPPAATGRPWGICVQGANTPVRIWVNGSELTRRTGAYCRFAFALEGQAAGDESTLTVRVNDVGRHGRAIGSVYLGSYDRIEDLLQGELIGRPARTSADWVTDAVIYEVYLRSFSPEGTFVGLEKRLDALQELGVTVLWLMPIHPVGRARRKGTLGSPYSVSDFYAVNPEFGTMADFESLLAAAHRRNMKLIIDLVANHTAWDCPLITEHPDWYQQNRDGRIRSPVPDWPDVAQLDHSKPGLRRYLTEVMRYWVREVGIDGFRCDVAGMLPLDFWEEVRKQLDRIKPVLMLAEDDQPAQHLHAFDLTYDWATPSLLRHLRTGEVTPADLAGMLSDEAFDFPTGSLRMRFSSNHDLCAWHQPALAHHGPEAARTAAVVTFTMPGVPLIYSGQEAANQTRLPLFERVPIDWTADDHGLRALYTDLARLRHRRISLRRGQTEILTEPAQAGILGLRRFTDEESTYVLINLTSRPTTMATGHQIPAAPCTLLTNGTLQNHAAARIDLPPLGHWLGAEPG